MVEEDEFEEFETEGESPRGCDRDSGGLEGRGEWAGGGRRAAPPLPPAIGCLAICRSPFRVVDDAGSSLSNSSAPLQARNCRSPR